MNDKQRAKLGARIRKLHALLGSKNGPERQTAHDKLTELLERHKLSWNDIPALLATPTVEDDPSTGEDDNDVPLPPDPLSLISRIIERHCHLSDAELVAVTLWIAHTFLYEHFSVTPRLALISPVRGCGKTTLLNIINRLSLRPRKIDNITGPSLFRLISREQPTALVDEADNLDWYNNPVLRAVINSGHHRDGKIMRLDTEFYTFGPLAISSIGQLPKPVMHRSVVIDMERSPMALPRFDPHTIPDQQADIDIIYRLVFDWARKVKLNTDPELPAELLNRPADNWRPLLAIADAVSDEWGKRARMAALDLCAGQEDDLGVVLLSDIRDIFDSHAPSTRLPSVVIVQELNEMPDAHWSEWRGLRGDQQPRPLTQAQLAQMLSAFRIRPRTIWPPRRGTTGAKSAKGYYRNQFEKAWASYCNGTPSQPTALKRLAS